MASSAAAVYTQMASWSMAVAYRFCDGRGEGREEQGGGGRGDKAFLPLSLQTYTICAMSTSGR